MSAWETYFCLQHPTPLQLQQLYIMSLKYQRHLPCRNCETVPSSKIKKLHYCSGFLVINFDQSEMTKDGPAISIRKLSSQNMGKMKVGDGIFGFLSVQATTIRPPLALTFAPHQLSQIAPQDWSARPSQTVPTLPVLSILTVEEFCVKVTPKFSWY